jgi:hypothetical protein
MKRAWLALVPLALAWIALRCNEVRPRGYCARSCDVTADCCPAVDAGCPGDYPKNYSCENGLCRAPVCQKDADCQPLLGRAAGCRAVNGRVGCVILCASDGDCIIGAAPDGGVTGGATFGTCVGTADDGARICGGGPPRCTADSDCLGKSHCADGRCGCLTDADCPTGRHCQDRACGCATDAECAPGLDRCTANPAFAYPPAPAAAGRL